LKHSTATDRQPNYIRVTHADQHATLAHFRLGEGRRRILIIAGIHGREHGGIQAAYELLERLVNRHLYGRIDLLPVCNPLAYDAETRFTPGSDRDMARSFTASAPSNLTEALSHAVLSLAEEAEVVLNLHSAGNARYLPHVMFYREQDAEFAASLGLPFAIKRGAPETLKHHIASRLRPEQRTVTLELGGGTVAFPEDVSLGVDRLLAFLGRSGFLGSGDYEREATPPDMIWLTDARQSVRAPGEGAFYTDTEPGLDFAEGEPFGFWVGLDELRPHSLLAPTTGKLVYLRKRNRVPGGGNVAMFLPTNGSTVRGSAGTSRMRRSTRYHEEET
jgi:predicted deacylase